MVMSKLKLFWRSQAIRYTVIGNILRDNFKVIVPLQAFTKMVFYIFVLHLQYFNWHSVVQSPKIAVTDELTFTAPGNIELYRVSFVLLLFLYIYKIFLFESVKVCWRSSCCIYDVFSYWLYTSMLITDRAHNTTVNLNLLLGSWHVPMLHTRTVQPVATCCQSPYVHN